MKQLNRIVATALLVLLGSFGVLSAYDQVIDGIQYNYVNGNTQELELVGFSESAISNKTVPQNLNLPMYPVTGKKLVSIGASAFRMNYTLNYFTSVKMPSSVRTIGARAFESVKLSQVDMSSTTVSNIPATCFQNCSATKILLPSTVTTIQNDAFAGCSYLNNVGNLKFENLTDISYRAFQNCSSLAAYVKLTKLTGAMKSQVFEGSKIRSLALGSGVTTTGNSLCHNCTILSKVTFDSKTITVAGNSFDGCAALDSVEFNSSSDGRITIQDYAFAQCTSLANITWGNVRSIGEKAFSHCTKLNITDDQWLDMKDLIAIGPYAFEYCTSMKTVNLTSAKKPNLGYQRLSIGNYAFRNCSAVTTLTLPSDVSSIGESAFRGMSALTSITIPPTITEIPAYMLYLCNHLKTIVLEGNIEQIGNGAFYLQSEKAFSVYMKGTFSPPNTQYAIFGNDDYACGTLYLPYISVEEWSETDPWRNFGRIEAMEVEYVSEDLPDIVFILADDAAEAYISKINTTTSEDPESSDCVYITEYADFEMPITKILAKACQGNTVITSFAVPGYCKEIGNMAFQGCSNLEYVDMYSSQVEKIGQMAFYGCEKLETRLPKGLQSIEESAFAVCTSFKYVYLPSTIKKISAGAFGRCSGIKAVLCQNSNSVPILDSDAFRSLVYENANLYVPGKNYSQYKSAAVWKTFKNIYNYSGGSNDGTMILYDGMPHKITSMGNTTTGYIDVNLYPGSSSQKAAYTDVKIHKEFRLANNGPVVRNWLTAPTVGQGSSYTYDYNYLLSSCPNLTSVDIADGFNYIPTRYFYNSSKLKTVKIGRMSRNYGTPAIQSECFYGCTNITSVTSRDEVAPLIYDTTFPSSIYTKATLYVPKGSTSSYRATKCPWNSSYDNYWRNFTKIQEYSASGDLNGDGSVDGGDVSILLEMVLAGGLSSDQIALADLNDDGSVDGGDVSILLEMVLAGD